MQILRDLSEMVFLLLIPLSANVLRGRRAVRAGTLYGPMNATTAGMFS